MTIKRRVEKLELSAPGNSDSYRVVFLGASDLAHAATEDDGENVILVRFVDTPSSRARRLVAAVASV